jgi:dethiobiotin synthetase
VRNKDPEQPDGKATPGTAIEQPKTETAPMSEPLPEALAAKVEQTRFACFVTGTDTEIGKTLVSAAILYKLTRGGQRACGMKPVAAGAEERDGELYNDDAAMLRAAGNVHLPRRITTPYLLREPCAPHIAAALEGVSIEPVPILTAYAEILGASDATVVEGVGGFCVPFSQDFDSADLAVQLGLPVVLVVGMRLGCINHALLTVDAIVARGLVLAGWVANMADPEMRFIDENIQALAKRIPAPLLGHVPRLKHPTAAAAADFIDLSRVSGWSQARA